MAGTIKHTWTGTVLTIESDSGTSSADLQGPAGATGIRGPQGPAGAPSGGGGGAGGAVDSVNGKTGVVVLTASDVGALPDTTTIPDAYTLPQASAGALGGVKADSATTSDIQPVRIGADGKLYTAQSTGGGGGSSVYVSGAQIDASGHLIITLSNGATIDAGMAKGADGAQGAQGAKGEDGANGTDGADGATFTPSVSPQGVVSWTNNGGLDNPAPVNIKGAQGAQGASGATFTPAVDSEGNLSWTNNGGLDNPPTVNIKGEKGDSGASASDTGWQGLTLATDVSPADTAFAVTPQYRKIGSRVFIKGHVKCSVPSGGRLIAIMPEGYRYLYGTHYDFAECGGQRIGRIYVDADGNLKCEWIVNISGGTFTSETWIQIDLDYLAD